MSCCLFFIVLVLPDTNKIEFAYEKGKPWEHEDLIAPFDFAVYKSPEEITAEQNDIRAAKPICYIENDSLLQDNIERFFAQTKLSVQEEGVCKEAFNIILNQK